MDPVDVGHIVEPSDPRVSPDATRVAFVVTRVDLEANRYHSAVWTAPVDGSEDPRQLTSGEHRDTRPRWSPDGRHLAFVSHREPTGAQLWLLPLAGGEARRLAVWSEEIEDVAWAPDGERIAFTARVPDEGHYAEVEERDRPPRRVTRLSHRLDDVGWTADRPRHLFVVGVSEGAVLQVTHGEFQDSGATWSPDGSQLAFSSGRTATWDTDLRTDLHVVAADGEGEPQPMTSCGRAHDRPAWEPGGGRIAFVHGDRRDFPRFGAIGVVDAGSGEERILTRQLDLHCAPYLASARDPAWDGGKLLFQADDRGAVSLLRLDPGTGAVEVVIAGDRQVTGFDVAGGAVAATVATPGGFPQVVSVVDGEERVLAAWDTPFPVSTPERFTATSSDGATVDAWVVRPLDGGPGPHPTLVNIHGGPFAQYGHRLFDEVQVQAGAGYAVVYANPRGSSGYGEAWARAIRSPKAPNDPGSGWGGLDADDVLAVVDEAVRRFPDVVDPARLGVLGGSYGGYLTSWLVGHTDRFAAACAERALTNMLTFVHTSDIGAGFPAGYIGVSHLDDPGEYLRQSPVTHAASIRTPLLLLHAEGDLRCPIEQAEDLFVRLKLLGRDVELVRFPGESHEMSRAGSPRHRVQRFHVMLEFFDRHLKEDA